jgi:arylsulfatase A-like enzyme/Tfp pilus assembly protein PilF
VSVGSWRGDNVLFVTIDTLRADHLPAYGRQDVKTPGIDSLAARGVLFERCLAATPLTLPSHTTIFSGTLPLHHAVRDNGAFEVPKQLPLLPELFKRSGYATAAFVGAFVLDSRWKLNRGFDEYFDQFDTRKANLISIGDIERPAGEVADAALAWLERRPPKPFFLWVHFYDPHAPYAPPPPFAEEYADRPYLGEIAYVDSQLSRVLAYLDGHGLSRTTAVVLAGDHGESLGTHQEEGHGFFVYQETLHVPLLVVPPGRMKASRAGPIVSLVDVMPTVAALAGLPLPAGVQGRSLVPLLSRRGRLDDRPAYAETYYPRFHFGWSELVSIQDGRWKLIESSDPELYDLAADPGETKNLAATDRERYLTMKRQLTSFVGQQGRNPLNANPAVQDPEAVRKLASLGYLTGQSEAPAEAAGPLPPPRSKVGVYDKLSKARALAVTDPKSAATMLREVLASDPEVVDAQTALANVYLRERREKDAIPLLEEAARRRPRDVTIVIALAIALRSASRSGDAEKLLESRVANGLEDGRLDFLLASMIEARGDRVVADTWFRRGAALDPRSAPWHAAMAEVLVNRDDLDGAEHEAAAALEIDPRVQGAHLVRAAVLEKRGRDQEALEEYAREVAVNAVDERSFRALAALTARLSRPDAEAAALNESMRRHPDAAYPRLYLARGLLMRGERLDEALPLALSALGDAVNDRQKAFACFLLADLYNRIGNAASSEEFAARGKELERTAGR